MIFLLFSSLLKVSKLQKSRKHKENHNLRKINCFFFVSPFWEKVPGWRWPAGWLARQASGPAPRPSLPAGSETFKSQENTRKITIYAKSFFFFPFWENSGLEMAGWLAGLGAASSSQPACQPSQPGQLPGQPASRPSPARNFPKKEKKLLILRKL